MTKNKSRGSRGRKIYSRLSDHRRIGKELVPPLAQIPNVQLISWMNDRLPEVLGAALVVTTLPRTDALAMFREIASIAREYKDTCLGPNLSDLAMNDDESFDRMVSSILRHPLGHIALKPLLLFKELPGYKRWALKLGVKPFPQDWEKVQKAVLLTINHQSQAATDCRWLGVFFFDSCRQAAFFP